MASEPVVILEEHESWFQRFFRSNPWALLGYLSLTALVALIGTALVMLIITPNRIDRCEIEPKQSGTTVHCLVGDGESPFAIGVELGCYPTAEAALEAGLKAGCPFVSKPREK